MCQNSRGGAAPGYLVDRYAGNLALALAAYNAGVEAVARYGGIPPYAETQGYVARVLRLAEQGRLTAGDVHAARPEGGESGAFLVLASRRGARRNIEECPGFAGALRALGVWGHVGPPCS